MAGTPQDIQAGRAFIKLTLDRTGYDQQVADLERSEGSSEVGRSVAGGVAQTVARGSASSEVGAIAATAALNKLGVQAATTTAALNKLGVQATTVSRHAASQLGGAASSAAGKVAQTVAKESGSGGVAKTVLKGSASATGAIAATAVFKRLGVQTASTTTSIAASGVAASAAATAFAALSAAALPIAAALAIIASAAGTVWLALVKWDELPLIFRALMLVLNPVALAIRSTVLAFKTLGLAVKLVLAPFWLLHKAVSGFFSAIRAMPGALVKMAGYLRRVAVAAGQMAVKVAVSAGKMAVTVAKMAVTVAKSAGEMAVRVARSAVEIGKSAAAIPGQIARSTSKALQNVGRSLLRIGSIASGIKLAIVGGATLAAQSWARYGERLRGVQNDLQRFNLTAEEASIVARVADQTGESMARLARDMRDGTRDFSRWRNEMQLSGNLMSGAGLSAALELSRAFFSLRMSVVGLKDTIASALGPELLEGAELLTGMVRGVTKWASANKPLIVQVFKVASAVGSAGIALTTLGSVISGAGAIVSPFVAGMAVLAGVMTAVEIRTGAGRSLWESYGGSVRRVVGGVLQDLGQMMAFADTVIGGVKDALIAGDLAGAVDVMWAGAKVAWASALLEIDELTSGTFSGIIQSLISGQWAAAGESAMNALKIAWLSGVSFLSGVWDTVVNAADAAWTGIVTAADTAWTGIVNAADTAWTAILTGFDQLITKMKQGLVDFLLLVVNQLQPLSAQLAKVGIVLDTDPLLAARGAIIDSMNKPSEDRAGALEERIDGRQTASDEARTEREEEIEERIDGRQTASDEARLAREKEIEDLRRRQKELAAQGGEEAKQQQTANQKALSDAIEAAKAAREAAAENKLKEEDFAVSEATQSIARFSGEALGLSVGRSNDPAERTAKLTADQLQEMKELRREIRENNRELRRLQAMGGFA